MCIYVRSTSQTLNKPATINETKLIRVQQKRKREKG